MAAICSDSNTNGQKDGSDAESSNFCDQMFDKFEKSERSQSEGFVMFRDLISMSPVEVFQ